MQHSCHLHCSPILLCLWHLNRGCCYNYFSCKLLFRSIAIILSLDNFKTTLSLQLSLVPCVFFQWLLFSHEWKWFLFFRLKSNKNASLPFLAVSHLAYKFSLPIFISANAFSISSHQFVSIVLRVFFPTITLHFFVIGFNNNVTNWFHGS